MRILTAIVLFLEKMEQGVCAKLEGPRFPQLRVNRRILILVLWELGLVALEYIDMFVVMEEMNLTQPS